tara:strand:- start:3620 stop:3955 length:336 start_codon:yes stop_codon:yes gene_type:complete
MLVPRLPDELWDLIHAHGAAAAIQTAFRCHMMRHTTSVEWPCLRSRLAEALSLDDLQRLVRSEHVRREWRREMDSWVSHTDGETMRDIAREVASGLWDPPMERAALRCFLV